MPSRANSKFIGFYPKFLVTNNEKFRNYVKIDQSKFARMHFLQKNSSYSFVTRVYNLVLDNFRKNHSNTFKVSNETTTSLNESHIVRNKRSVGADISFTGAFNTAAIKKKSVSIPPIKFDIDEIFKIIKRERKVQIKILKELFLYLPVMFCDVLLLVACWKFLRHIFQQIAIKDHSLLDESISTVRLRVLQKMKQRKIQYRGDEENGYVLKKSKPHTETAKPLSNLLSECDEKTWFPPK